MTIERARLWALVETAAENITDSTTGRFEQKPLEDELAKQLRGDAVAPHVKAISFDILCRKLAAQFVRQRTPRPSSEVGMFHPKFVLPLGKGSRVWMEHATADDLRKWGALSTRNAAKILQAEATRQEYVGSRIEIMNAHPGRLLGQVERDHFGYPIEDPPDLDDDVEGDDE